MPDSAIDAFDEFGFLPEQAAVVGRRPPFPAVHRESLTLPDGRTLSAIRWGTEPARVTLLHGAGLNAHTWDTTVLALDIPTLAIDLAGHGDSSWRDDASYTPALLAPDVAAAIGAWTDRRQILVGHSLGGLTAAAVAAHRPDLISALAIIDITPGIDASAGPSRLRAFFAGPTDWADREELVDRALAFGLGGDREAARRGVFLNSRVRPDGRVEWKHHFARLAAAASTSPDHDPADSRDAVLGERGWDDLAAVTAPVLLLRGDRGYVTEADAAEFARRVPTATTETLASGHNVHEEHPLALGRRIRALAEAVTRDDRLGRTLD